jgi:hypothetical protein
MSRVKLRTPNLIEQFLLGDVWWARFRFITIFIFLFGWYFLVSRAFGSTVQGLRSSIAPLFAIVSVFLLGARYVQDIYNLQSYRAAFWYMFSSFMGVGYSTYKIEHGKKEPDSDKLGIIEEIGGPGYLFINPGNVVLIEKLQGPSAVCGNGWHFLSRFERIGTIVDLEEQQFDSKLIKATSKDGIKVVVKNVYYHYRLLPGQNRDRTISDPYPYSIQAVRNFAYDRAVTAGGLTFWEKAVQSAVEGSITDYINRHLVDRITAPSDTEKDPRDEIGARIRSAETRNKLRNIGTDLVWFDIGSINAGDTQVDTQRLKAWQAFWDKESTLLRTEGEARRSAYQELGRVEAQSDLLKSILNSFRSVEVSGDNHKENIRRIVMARTAQLLDSMSSLYRNQDKGLVPNLSYLKVKKNKNENPE